MLRTPVTRTRNAVLAGSGCAGRMDSFCEGSGPRGVLSARAESARAARPGAPVRGWARPPALSARAAALSPPVVSRGAGGAP
ncbi:MAG TPA: hypothetical protein VF665_07800, partial [Longimicrobium sp.]|uniref:hypothetical protein n=1 Tax=Longimicrobium sp. TaxID=2029185 RepID=UPI002ED80E25